MRHGSGGLGHRRGAMQLCSGGAGDVRRGSSEDQTVALEQGTTAWERARRLRWWHGVERRNNAAQEQGAGTAAQDAAAWSKARLGLERWRHGGDVGVCGFRSKHQGGTVIWWPPA